MRSLVACAAMFLLFVTPSMANDVAQKYVPNAEKVGAGRLSIAFWQVYDATLYAPHGTWNARAPYALSIQYLRDIEGADIADRSVEEIRNQGFSNEATLAEWKMQMRKMFPNVKNGAKLTAVFTPQNSTDFYLGDIRIGRINGAEFATHFFNIWLGEATSEPQLRKELLGLS